MSIKYVGDTIKFKTGITHWGSIWVNLSSSLKELIDDETWMQVDNGMWVMIHESIRESIHTQVITSVYKQVINKSNKS